MLTAVLTMDHGVWVKCTAKGPLHTQMETGTYFFLALRTIRENNNDIYEK